MIPRTATLCLAAALALGVPSSTSAQNPRHPSAAGHGRGPAVNGAVPRGGPGGGHGHVAGPPPAAYGRPAPPPMAYARGYGYGPPAAYYPGWSGPRYYSYYGAHPVYYPRPYYAFRPQLSIGFGLWAGFPVPYPTFGFSVGYGTPGVAAYGYPAPYGYPVPGYGSAYPVPYPVPQPYPVPYPAAGAATGYGQYGQAPQGTVTAQPAAPQYGGLSFEISPADAVVYVDGAYAGPVSSFAPNTQPLGLSPGVHHIDIQAPGYQSLTFDATITAGLVVPYRGTLPRGY